MKDLKIILKCYLLLFIESRLKVKKSTLVTLDLLVLVQPLFNGQLINKNVAQAPSTFKFATL